MNQYNKNDKVTGDGASPNLTVSDFWQWAFGDLCDDDIKGIYAEWVVTKLLGIVSTRRVSWANSDIITPEGVRIEIKASAYWQSWKLINEDGTSKKLDDDQKQVKSPSVIRFSGLMAKDAVNNHTESKASYKSDLYIFCFQNEADHEQWNALNLDQWEFYVFDLLDLKKFAGKSVSLKKLREHQKPLNANKFVIETQRLIKKCI